MANFNVPASPKIYKENFKDFKGVDFATNVAGVSTSRSPNAQNIMTNLDGKPVKRTGYHLVNMYSGAIGSTKVTYSGAVNMIGSLKTVIDNVTYEKYLIQLGDRMYEGDISEEELPSGAKIPCFINVKRAVNLDGSTNNIGNNRSMWFQNNGKLYIVNGGYMRVYGQFNDEVDEDNEPVFRLVLFDGYSEVAKEPTVVIGRKPNGQGGTEYEPINMLRYRRIYSFFVGADDAETKEFHITADDSLIFYNSESDSGLDRYVKVRLLGEDGEWGEWHSYNEENRIFNVTSLGSNKKKIVFNTAPGASPGASNGIDNVQISIMPYNTDSANSKARDLIGNCKIGIVYGVNGAADRLFLSGNPKAPNFVYWSDTNDFSYFPTNNYMYLGQDASAIVGFSVAGNNLIVYKEADERDENIFSINGSYNSSTMTTDFAVTGSIQGEGAISQHGFARLDNEPLFLSKHGVYSITNQYLTLDRYAQSRSWFVNPKMILEPNMKDAVATNHNNYIYLAFPSGNVYVADGRQKTYERLAPQSTFQYEWYYLTNIPAHIWWEHDDYLWFGTNDGKICRMFNHNDDENTLPIYADCCKVDSLTHAINWSKSNVPIEAFWDTPYLSFGDIGKYKTLKGMWVMTAPEFELSSIDILYHYKGQYIDAKYTTLDTFGFDHMDFSDDRNGFTRFSFIIDDGPLVVATNRKAKKFILIQFRIKNFEPDEGFGFYEFEVTYTINGKNKG